MCLDSQTWTNPTGAAMIPLGQARFLRINVHSSIKAVGAFPNTKRALGCSSTAMRIPACVRVIPFSCANFTALSSDK